MTVASTRYTISSLDGDIAYGLNFFNATADRLMRGITVNAA